MERVRLANGVEVPRLGFGCEQLGGFAWGDVQECEVTEAVLEALERGMTVFDTADVYGTGLSETRLGDCLKGSNRDRAFVVNKFGVRLDADKTRFPDNSNAWLNTALDASLRRLQMDYVDLYLVHTWDQKTPWDALFESLERKVSAGKIRSYGVSNVAFSSLPKGMSKFCVSLETEFSLCNRKSEDSISQAQALSELVPFFFGCLGQGILSGKYRSSNDFAEADRRHSERYVNFHGERLQKNLRIVEEMRGLSTSLGKTLPQIALRWLLDFHPRSVVLTGIKRKAQLMEVLGASDWSLPAVAFDRLSQLSM